jgi:hypothetical protein
MPAPLSAFPDREHFKNPTSPFSEPTFPNILRGGIGSLTGRPEALSGMVPSAPTKTKGGQKKPSYPLKVAKSPHFEHNLPEAGFFRGRFSPVTMPRFGARLSKGALTSDPPRGLA